MEHEDIVAALTRHEDSIKSHNRRIDALERDSEALQKMATSLAVLTEQSKHTSEKVSEIETDVKSLKQAPADRWERLIAAIVTAVVGVIVGYMMRGGVL